MEALQFTVRAHHGQVRKYTGHPYWYHCIEVATLVEATPGCTEDMIIAALLHDTVEDTPTTLNQIAKIYGFPVAFLVEELTEVTTPEDGNRAQRKLIERERLKKVSLKAKTIKLADIYSNMISIIEHDKDFAKVFIAEMELLMPLLIAGDTNLYMMNRKIISQYYQGNQGKIL